MAPLPSVEAPIRIGPPARGVPYAGRGTHASWGANEIDDIRFSRPLYSVADAARYVGMSPSTLSSWAHGYTRRFADRADVRMGPVITDLGHEGRGPSIPFIGLVEAMVVQAFRETGLPLQRIRRALWALAADGSLQHPLASRHLYTDGAQLLFDYATAEGAKDLRLLTVVESGQRVFHEVIGEYLRRITFGDRWATGLVLPITDEPILRILPEVAGGQPLFIEGGAPLGAIVSRQRAGESVASIADDYAVPAHHVDQALRAVLPQAA